MNPDRLTELELIIRQQQLLFETALDGGTEFSMLKKIWVELKSLQEEWKILVAQTTE